MTCGPYDRARALIDGTVKPEGIDLEILVNESPGRHTTLNGRECDIAEYYTGTYIADLPYKTIGYTAIPIFVKRMFRHSYIYINKRAGIRAPAGLNGKRIGVQNWLTTTAVWARGLLADEYGLDLRSATWIADRMSGVGDWKPPAWLKVEVVPRGQNNSIGSRREKLTPPSPPEHGPPMFIPISTFCFPITAILSGITSNAPASFRSCIRY